MAVLNNITQLSSWSIAQSHDSEKQIDVRFPPAGPNPVIQVHPYYVKALPSASRVIKFGYCCEPLGDPYPIYLTFADGVQKRFYVSKGGMFEFQPEQYQDKSVIEDEEQVFPVETAKIYVKSIMVPANIKFVIDLMYEL